MAFEKVAAILMMSCLVGGFRFNTEHLDAVKKNIDNHYSEIVDDADSPVLEYDLAGVQEVHMATGQRAISVTYRVINEKYTCPTRVLNCLYCRTLVDFYDHTLGDLECKAFDENGELWALFPRDEPVTEPIVETTTFNNIENESNMETTTMTFEDHTESDNYSA